MSTAAKASKTATAKKTAPVAANKDRRGDFVRLAKIRAKNAVEAIRLLGNLSNTAGYEYTQADVDAITKAIRDELSTTEARFKASLQKVERRPVALVA